MSLNTSFEFHREFLSTYFNLPKPDRPEPYIPAGLRGAKDFSQGFPDESLVDHFFTPKEDVDVARFRLLDAYLAFNLESGWLTLGKNPVSSEAKCGHKQGFCRDRDLLVRLYTSRCSGDARWWPEFLGYHTNIGAAPFVIDLDYKPERGVDACQTFFAFLAKNGVDLHTLPVVYTPGGGLHVYFQHYEGAHVSRANFASQVWGGGVDIRGNGMLVLGAGSFATTPDGTFKQYTVINNTPLPHLPACIVEEIENYNKGKKQFSVPRRDCEYTFDSGSQIDIACRIVASKQEGERNSCLNCMAFAMGKLIRDGKEDEEKVKEKLLLAALQTGLGEAEILNTINSGINGGKASDQPYEPFNKNEAPMPAPSAEGSAEPSVRKASAAEKTDQERVVNGKEDDKAFLAEKELANFTYSPGFLTRFAERKGRLDEARVDAIAQAIFPTKIYDYVKDLNRLFKLDLTAAVQAMATVPCQTVKGARLVDLGGKDNTMPANLFVMLIGAPASGKTLLARQLYRPLQVRQTADFEKFVAEWEEFIMKKAEWERQKQKDGPRPMKPTLRSYIMQDGTIEAVIARAQENPEGINWVVDEGAGQATLGASRYNPSGEASVMGYMIKGYDGGTILKELKKDKGEQNAEFVRKFCLGVTFNIQDKKVRETFGDGLEDQGYLPRWLHIRLPARAQGKRGSVIRRNAEESLPNFDYFDECMNKLMDLTERRGTEEHLGILKFSEEAYELHNAWCEEITERCNYGDLQAYIDRFCQANVLRLALGLHYLHLAAQCVENREGIGAHENFNPQQIEKVDMERAIAVSDLFLASLDEFLWLRKTPTRPVKQMLTRDEEKLAQHVLSNYQFYMKPRTAKEIIEQGFETSKTPTELSLWLKGEGFAPIKKGSKASRQVARYDLNGLKPWAGAIDLSRLAFTTQNDAATIARTIFVYWKSIKGSAYKMTNREFAAFLKSGDEADCLVNAMVSDRRFLVDAHEGMLLFREETLAAATKILADEGLLYNGKLVAEAA